ncbi:MAG: universal stress protein [Caldilineaceae bacterium]|nr:universal stress protein [Caldilineaceae bacterium]
MFHKILIPLDTSPLAERVLHYLPQFARNKEVELLLVGAIEPSMYTYAMASDEPLLISRLMEDIEQGFREYLAGIQERLQNEGYRVSTHLLHGDAAQCISDVATHEQCDLIAMTTHGRTGFSRWMLGSVADRVIRTADQPILLLRADLDLSTPYAVNHILLPLDGSDLAEQALPLAENVARQTNADVLMLHVLQQLTYLDQQLLDQTYLPSESYETNRMANARNYLANMGDRLHMAQVHSSSEIVTGEPGKAILDRAAADKIDLIVMSSHGRSGYSRWAYGSIAAKVLHGAPCPLLLMRGIQKVKVEDAEVLKASAPVLDMQAEPA